MLFSEGYMETDYMFLQKKADKDIKGLEDLKGKTITVNKGSAYETWAKANAEKYGFKYDVYGTNADAVQAVLSGRADANMAGHTVVLWAAKQNPAVKATYTYKTGLVWAMPFRLDDKEGRAQVNNVLKCMKLDGTVARLHEKWFGIKPEKDSWVYKVAPGHGVPGHGRLRPGADHAEVLVDIDSILEVRGLHKSFGTLEVLKGIDLAVAQGELVFIIGPVGLGQVDAAALLQPAGGAHQRLGGGRRHRHHARPTSTSTACARRSAWCSSRSTSIRT